MGIFKKWAREIPSQDPNINLPPLKRCTLGVYLHFKTLDRYYA